MIKIRAWDPVDHKMLYTFTDKNYNVSLETGTLRISTGGASYDYRELEIMLCLSTDVKGKDMFVGDIVQWGIGWEIHRGQICLENGGLVIKDYQMRQINAYTSLEVIGNKYENSDLFFE